MAMSISTSYTAAFLSADTPPTLSIQPSVSYIGAGLTAIGPSNTTANISFQIADAESLSANKISYQIRTGQFGSGALIAQSTATQGVTEVYGLIYTSSGLEEGVNILYLRVWDEDNNYIDSNAFIVKVDSAAPDPTKTISTSPDPALGDKQYRVIFTPVDYTSNGLNELIFQIRTASGGGGTLLASTTSTGGSTISHDVPVLSALITDSALTNGATRYVRVRDAAGSWTDTAFTVALDQKPTISAGPTLSYGSGFTRVGPGNIYGTITATATDTEATTSFTWELRTGASGSGTLVRTGTIARDVSTDLVFSYNDPGLVSGSNSLKLRVWDGYQWSDDYNVTVLRDDVGPTSSTSVSHTPNPVTGTNEFTLTFTPHDALSTGAGELRYEIRTDLDGGGTLLGSGTATDNTPLTTGTLEDNTLSLGSNTRYIRVRDGAGNWTDTTVNIVSDATLDINLNDSGVVSANVTAAVKFISFIITDSGVISGSESLNKNLTIQESGSVSGVISIPNPPIPIVAFPVNDSGEVSGSEVVDIFITDITEVQDSGEISGAETVSFDVTIDSIEESGTVSGFGYISIDGDFSVLESGTVSGNETVNILVLVQVEDSGEISGAETISFIYSFTKLTVFNVENATRVAEQLATSDISVVIYPRESDIDNFIQGKLGTVKYKFEMWKVDNSANKVTNVSSKVTSGSITVNKSQSVARTGTFLFSDLDGIDLKKDYLMPIVILDIKGVKIEYPQGVFQCTAPTRDNTEKKSSYNLVANDLSIILADKFSYPFTIPAGSNYVEAIRTILAVAGLDTNNFDITPTDKVTPNDFTWEPETPKSVAVNDLLQGIAYLPYWFSPTGRMTSLPREHYADRDVDVHYTTLNNDGIKIITDGFPVSINQSDIKNEVVVQVNDPLRDPLWSAYYIENPASPIVIPAKNVMTGFSNSNYLEAPTLQPFDIITATPASNYSGAVAVGGWVYLNSADTNKAIAGMWGGSGNLSFALAAAGSTAGRPTFLVSGDGSTYKQITVPTTPSTGWHHVIGSFNPGGPFAPNAIQNGDFESGPQAAGSNWVTSGDLPVSKIWNTDIFTSGTRSLQVEVKPTTAGQNFSVYQTLKSGWTVGNPVYLELKRLFQSRSSTQFKVGVVVSAIDRNNTVLSELLNTTWNSVDASFQSYAAYSAIVPVNTVLIRLELKHYNDTATTGTAVCLWDQVSLRDATLAEMCIYLDGVKVVTSNTSLPAALANGTSKFRIGTLGTQFGANTQKIFDIGLWYSHLGQQDVTALYGNNFTGAWPPNIPFSLGYWYREKPTMAHTFDYTSHGNTMMVVGNPTVVEDTTLGRNRFLATVEVVNLPRIVNQTIADATARLVAEDLSSSYTQAVVNTTIDPRRDLNELYTLDITNADGVITTSSSKWVVDGWTMEFRTGGRMSHTVRKVEAY